MSVTGWKEKIPFRKYPSEILTRTMDASAQIPDGVTVSAVEMNIYDADGTETTEDMLVGSPSVAALSVFTVQAGESDTKYEIRAVFTLNNGDTPKLILPLQVL